MTSALQVSGLQHPATLFLVAVMGLTAWTMVQHLLFWRKLPEERAHFWIALWALATLFHQATRLMQFAADSVEASSAALRLGIVVAVAAASVAVGAVEALTGRAGPRTLRVVLYGVLHPLLAWLLLGTRWVFTHDGHLATDAYGRSFLWIEPGPLLPVLLPWVVFMVGYGLWMVLTSRTLRREDGQLLAVGVLGYMLPALWDTAVTMADVRAPLLFDYAFLPIAIAFNVLINRRYLRSRDELFELVRRQTLELREANQQLQGAVLEARDAAAVKGRFLANLSHEVRTPLNGLLASTQMLVDEPLEPEATRLAGIAARAARTMQELVDDVLDLAAVEAGAIAVRPDVIDPAEVLEETVRLFESAAVRSATKLILDVRPGSLPPMLVDPLRLKQITSNLVSNAIKHAGGGTVRVQAEPRGSVLHVQVVDDGPGLEPEEQRRVFEAFHSRHSSVVTTAGNSGLGLPIAREMVRRLGGTMGLDSELGHGSTFWFTLPVGDVAGRAPGRPLDLAEASLPVALGNGRHILVAEDVPLNQEVARLLLHRLGFTCSVVEDGFAAVQQALSGRYDAVLMDVRMPGMDGLAATRRLRGAGSAVPIIATTANAFTTDRKAAERAGVTSFLAKPLELTTLGRALFEVLGAPPGSGLVDEASWEISSTGDSFQDSVSGWVELFLKDARERVSVLNEAARTFDPGRVASAAHAIKGAARTLGLDDVSTLARELELEGQRGRVPGPTAIDRLVRALEAVELGETRASVELLTHG